VIEIKAAKDQRQQAEAEAHVAAAILHDVDDERLETGRRQACDGVVDKVAPRLCETTMAYNLGDDNDNKT
jgi:hypothetical protein